MNKTLLIALSTIILGSTYVSAAENITMSANDTHKFAWRIYKHKNNDTGYIKYKLNTQGYDTPDGTIRFSNSIKASPDYDTHTFIVSHKGC